MRKLYRKINRWLWTNVISSGGHHKLKIYQTPFGVFWYLRWGYWVAGFIQFFSMGKLYIKLSKRIKL